MKNTEMKNTAYMISWDNILLFFFFFFFIVIVVFVLLILLYGIKKYLV